MEATITQRRIGRPAQPGHHLATRQGGREHFGARGFARLTDGQRRRHDDGCVVEERQLIVAAANRSNPDIDLSIIGAAGTPMIVPGGETAPDFLTRDLGEDIIATVDPHTGSEPRTVTVALPDEMHLRVNLPFSAPTPPLLNPRTNTLIFAAIGAIALLVWATRVLSTRLRNFAQAVADPQGSGPIVAALGWLQGTLLGNVATAVAVMAVAAVGFLMLTGRMNWRFGATVIIGCFILFGAGAIVSGIQSAAAVG